MVWRIHGQSLSQTHSLEYIPFSPTFDLPNGHVLKIYLSTITRVNSNPVSFLEALPNFCSDVIFSKVCYIPNPLLYMSISHSSQAFYWRLRLRT